jgi:hypothetical protein
MKRIKSVYQLEWKVIAMKIGFLEKMAIKKFKNTSNKTKVNLCINNIVEIYNPLSIITNNNSTENNNAKINDIIVEYIKNETENISKRNGLIISIKISRETNGEIKLIENIIKKYIQKELIKVNKRIRRTNKNAFIFTIIGVFLIAITQFYNIIEKGYAFNEFIIVMSWVFMWKAVEIIFFELVKLIKEKAILLKIYYSEIIKE